MAATTFYFAIGRAYRKADLDIALATGQRHFIVPAHSLAARRLCTRPDIRVALDSEAYPPNNPRRISLADYWQAVLAWRRGPSDWGNLDWFASYDTIGDPAQTRRDEQELQRLIARDAPHAPVLKVVGCGMPIAEAAATILAHPLPGAARPSFALGGLAVAHYSATAEAWYTALLSALEQADDDQRAALRLHLFGIGKASWVLRSDLVTSFDSSGPARMAGDGCHPRLRTHYTPIYGISIEKLHRSRSARLYLYLASYRRAVGLPWTRLDETLFDDDRRPPTAIQHALELDDERVAA